MKSGNIYANMNKRELLPQTHSLTLSCNFYIIICIQTHYFTVAQICFSWNSMKAPVPVSLPLLQRSLPPAHSRQGSAVLALAQCSELLKTAAAVPCFCSLALCCGLFSSGEQQEQNEREWCDTASFTKKEILRKMSWFLESTQNTETDKLTPSTRHEELCRNKLNTQNS